MMNNQEASQLLVDFLQSIELPVILVPDVYQNYRKKVIWEHTAISDGVLYVDAQAHPGHIAHEAGHIATCPSEARHLLNGDMPYSDYEDMVDATDPRWLYWNDSAACGWSFFAALESGIDPKLPFEVGYDMPMPEVVDEIKLGFQVIVGSAMSCQLYYAGMLNCKNSDRLSKWLQD